MSYLSNLHARVEKLTQSSLERSLNGQSASSFSPLRHRSFEREDHRVLHGAAQRGTQFYFIFALLQGLFPCSKLQGRKETIN